VAAARCAGANALGTVSGEKWSISRKEGGLSLGSELYRSLRAWSLRVPSSSFFFALSTTLPVFSYHFIRILILPISSLYYACVHTLCLS
jgi:hypothetical protein